MIRLLALKHRNLWKERVFIRTALSSFALFGVSLIINAEAIQYAIQHAGPPTTDIILSNIPVINTDIIFTGGAIVFMAFVFFLILSEPKTLPYTLKSVGLFIIIRAAFVIMTHYGPYADQIHARLDIVSSISSGSDLFFSGHTGLPFLLALLYWQKKLLRVFFLFSSVVAAIAVLLGHFHYTIDVFSAFFITYSISKITERFFPNDWKLFLYGLDHTNIL